MKTLDQYFNEYESAHQNRVNKILHYCGIPLILFSLLGLLSHLGVGVFSLGGLVWLGASVFYIRLNLMWGATFSALTLVALIGSIWVPQIWHWVLFITGWILQGIGHYVFEKKSPAFLENFVHFFIGPFWIFVRLFSRK